MTKDRIIPIVSSIFVILVISFATLIPSNYWKLLFSIIFCLTCVGISYLVKKRSILSINKRQVLMLMGFSAFLYILLLMVLGISFGFFRSIDVISKSSIISSITVGGKAIGKKYATKNSDKIISIVGKIMDKFSRKK